MQRITVNLAPAELRKEGAGLDVPIAIAVLAAAGVVRSHAEPTLFLGEVSLDGTLRHTSGVLPLAALAREQRVGRVVVPAVNAAEAALIEGVTVLPVETLTELVAQLNGDIPFAPFSGTLADAPPLPEATPDLADVRGQEHAKRELGCRVTAVKSPAAVQRFVVGA